MGFLSFRELILSRSPNNSSLLAYPLDVVPFGCAVLVLGQDASRRVCPHLGSREQHAIFRLQGLYPRKSQPRTKHNMVSVAFVDLPLLDFTPPHGLNPQR
jgi:hypothetical protein